IDLPATGADSAANLTTAHFCAADLAVARVARYILELPARARAQFEVVASDARDSTRVLRSETATCNGGLPFSFPPLILHASSSHLSNQLTVNAYGSGLGTAQSARLVSRDSSWDVPLQVNARNESSVTASAEVAATLPGSILEVTTTGGGLT